MDHISNNAVREALLASISESIYVVTEDGRVGEPLSPQDLLEISTGSDTDELTTDLSNILDEPTAARLDETIQQVLSTGRRQTVNCTVQAEAKNRWVEIELVPLDTETDSTRAVLGLVRELSRTQEVQRSVLREAFDQAPVGVTLTDPTLDDNPIIYANQTFSEITGYSEADVLGRNCRFLQGENTRTEKIEQLRTAVAANEPVTVELRNYRKDGTEFWNRVSIAPVSMGAGEQRRFVGFQEDITERKEQEHELYEQRESIETIVDHVPMVLFAFDSDGVFVRSQGSALERLGLEDGEAVGMSAFEMYADNETICDDIRRSLAGEIVTSTVDIEGLTFETWYHPLFDEDGTVEEVVGFALDITERKQRERELELRNRAINEAPIGITIHDASESDSPIVFASDGLEALTGYTHEDLMGESLSLLDGKETDPSKLAELERAIEHGRSASVTALLYKSDGTPLWSRIAVFPVTDSDDTVTHVVSFQQDVTEEKEYEQRIERRLAEFSELLAAELRQPLTAAQTNLSTIQDCDNDEALDSAQQAISQVASLIDDITTINSFEVKSREQSEAALMGAREQE